MLPSVQLVVDGVRRNVLVDTGCSTSIICASSCSNWTESRASFVTVSGETTECLGVGHVFIELPKHRSVKVDVLVVKFRPIGFDFILGMNGITSLGGVSVNSVGQRVNDCTRADTRQRSYMTQSVTCVCPLIQCVICA